MLASCAIRRRVLRAEPSPRSLVNPDLLDLPERTSIFDPPPFCKHAHMDIFFTLSRKAFSSPSSTDGVHDTVIDMKEWQYKLMRVEGLNLSIDLTKALWSITRKARDTTIWW